MVLAKMGKALGHAAQIGNAGAQGVDDFDLFLVAEIVIVGEAVIPAHPSRRRAGVSHE